MSDTPRNPFEHHHHHHDDDGVTVELDPAQKALADALRVSFVILMVLMLALTVTYLFSNTFRVEENQRAVKLMFGEVVKDAQGNPMVLESGGPYFAWPYPIQDKVFIRTAPIQTDIDRAFWFDTSQMPGGQTLDQLRGGPLNPERDGSVLTGDGNILHLKAKVTWQISDVVDYLQHVRQLDRAEELVRAATEQALVHTAAIADVDELYGGSFNRGRAVQQINDTLDSMATGVTVTSVSLDRREMPLAVRDAFQAVVNAEQEINRRIESARQERSGILNEAAGDAHEALTALIEAYERAERLEDTQAQEDIAADIARAFE
ncbi:MAG: SPFH domain-containing protein, partial [Phycisphaeraceae bacterium]|nr:SPFH domain-containing protein [Phycisphaeraceae bacterium]